MNTRDEMADESVAASSWFGFDQLRLSDDDNAVIVTVGSQERWDKSHLRRLRQSADLPGLVPVVDADQASDGKPYAVAPAIDSNTLVDRLPPSTSEWADCAAITEAAARAVHEAHLRGLFHGALSPEQIHVIESDVAVAGVGLGLGGEPAPEHEHWIAPEVREGGDATERSDVYSLGKVLEASLGSSIDDVPRSVRRLIMWSSSDTPEARPPSALEFASILAEALGDDRPTYSPAFIPTAEITDLASTASETVAAHMPSARPSPGGAGLAAGAVAGAGAASLVSSLLDDGPTATPPTETELAEATSQPAEIDEHTDAIDQVGTSTDLDLGAATTAEVSEAEIDAAVGEDGGFDSRHYVDGLDEDEGYDLPAAARTVDIDEDISRDRGNNWAGILIGGFLAAGLLLVAYQLLSTDNTGSVDDSATPSTPTAVDGSDTGDTETGDTETGTNTTATTVSTTASVTTETTVSTTASTASTSSTTTETSTTTEAPAAIEGPALATGPIAADEAGVQILHGIPDQDVDMYLNGEALVPGFAPGTIAGPADLDPGTYDVALYAAIASPPASADDRNDDALVAETVTIGADPSSLVAHLDGDGNPTLSAFVEDLSTLAAGKSRIEIRHLAAAPGLDLLVGGEPISDALLEPGSSTALVLDAGDHTIEALTGDGLLKTATITVSDGELASVSFIGSIDDGIEVAVQRYTGLASAPGGVPTGDSDLPGSGDMTGLYLIAALAALMAAGGGGMMIRRSRRLL